MPGPGAVLRILKSPCPSLDTIAFSVSLLIQPQQAGALQTLSKSEADGKESKVHVSIRTALVSKADLITFQLQRPGTTRLARVLEVQLLACFQRACSSPRPLAQRTGAPFSVRPEAVSPNSSFGVGRWAPSPDD